MSELWLCGACFCLRGRQGIARQLCRCPPVEEHEALSDAAYELTGEHWRRVAELCRCCGAELIDAVHKFCHWFCRPCLQRAVEVNREVQFCAIPVGWHSIVNGVFGRAKQVKTPPGATAVADQLNSFFRESAGVWEWGLLVIERHWRCAGLPLGQQVDVEDYLRAVRAGGVDREALFDELARARGVLVRHAKTAPIPFRADWKQIGDCHECHDRIVWERPDGPEEYAPLILHVSSSPTGVWLWTVIVGGQGVEGGARALSEGVGADLERAKEGCETAAIALIREQEVRFA